jgi:superfamily I DNA and/or RNA helicase
MLEDHTLVERIVANADSYVGTLFTEAVLADLLKVSRQAPEFERLKGLALRLVQPFKSIVIEDERRLASIPKSRRLSATLTEQRRMHPAIADVVSKAFYGGDLTTASERTNDALAHPGPVEAVAPLPDSPIIVVDFEHVSRSGRSEPMERDDPRWHNPEEVEAVMDVLKLVRARSGSSEVPTLAILSPYRAQVVRLSERLDTLRASGQLPSLGGFAPVRKSVGLVGTEDSFQGAEADLVVISLVRNNARTGRPALGFLRDARRMNVLLSRAKSRLILVGSLRFLREAVRGVNPGGDPGELDFLTIVLDTLMNLQSHQAPNGTPFATVIRPGTLSGI